MKKIFIVLLAGLFNFAAQAQTNRISSSRSLEEKLNEEYCTGLFKSTEGTILDVASSNSAMAYLNILDWMQGRISGFQVYNNGYGASIPLIRGFIPGVYLDEVPVSLNTLSLVNTNDIAIVKVIKTPFFGGFNSSGGAIAIYTLATDMDEDEDHETK